MEGGFGELCSGDGLAIPSLVFVHARRYKGSIQSIIRKLHCCLERLRAAHWLLNVSWIVLWSLMLGPGHLSTMAAGRCQICLSVSASKTFNRLGPVNPGRQ